MLEYIVSKNGEYDYYTLQEALDAVPYNTKAKITIKEGLYREKIFSDKHDLIIEGEGDVIIDWDDYGYQMMEDGLKRGTFRSYTAIFSGEKLKLKNLTIMNSAGTGSVKGQAVALYLDVLSAKIENVKLLGYQDTLFLAPLPQEEREKRGFYGPRFKTEKRLTKSVFKSCYIEGSVDFIFGGGDALFIDSEIKSIEKGFVTAPSGFKEDKGFVFLNCNFTSSNNVNGPVYLMRPWRDEGKMTVLSSKIGEHIEKDMWCAWNGRPHTINTAYFGMDEETDNSNIHFIYAEDKRELLSYFLEG